MPTTMPTSTTTNPSSMSRQASSITAIILPTLRLATFHTATNMLHFNYKKSQIPQSRPRTSPTPKEDTEATSTNTDLMWISTPLAMAQVAAFPAQSSKSAHQTPQAQATTTPYNPHQCSAMETESPSSLPVATPSPLCGAHSEQQAITSGTQMNISSCTLPLLQELTRICLSSTTNTCGPLEA